MQHHDPRRQGLRQVVDAASPPSGIRSSPTSPMMTQAPPCHVIPPHSIHSERRPERGGSDILKGPTPDTREQPRTVPQARHSIRQGSAQRASVRQTIHRPATDPEQAAHPTPAAQLTFRARVRLQAAPAAHSEASRRIAPFAVTPRLGAQERDEVPSCM